MQNDPELQFWQSLTSLVRSQVESDAETSRAPQSESVAAVAPTPPITPPCSRSSSTVALKHSIDHILSQTQSMAFPMEPFKGAASISNEVYLSAIPTLSLPPASHFPPPLDYKTYTEWATQHHSVGNYNDYSGCSLLDDACDSAKRCRWTLARLLINANENP